MKKTLYALPLAIALTACAGSSKMNYMAANDPGDYGYYASALEEDRYRVAYKVRGDDVSTAKDYAMLRAAELTLQNGYDWFEIVDRNTNSEQEGRYPEARMRVAATTYNECGLLGCTTVTRPAFIDTTYSDRINNDNTSKSTVTFIEVVMGNGETPDGGNIYDARSLIENIRS